jgi:hypothetical protein
MNWRNIFKPSEILTSGDRAELEKLDAATSDLRVLADRIHREWPDALNRIERIRSLAELLCTRPNDAELYRKLEMAAAFPSHVQTGFQHKEAALGTIHAAIEAKLEPSAEIVRRVLSRALAVAEGELRKTEKSERKLAEDEGYAFSPSGRILALQARVLELRNAVAAKYKHEGGIQNPPEWRERLREWL